MSTPCHDPRPRTLDMLCTKCGKPWESYEFAGRTHMSPSCRCTYASGKKLRKFRRHEGQLKGHLARLRDRIRDAEVELDRIERAAPRRRTA